MKIAICILARNEESKIGQFLAALSTQSILRDSSIAPTLFVVANGCTDETAKIAEHGAELYFTSRHIPNHVFNFTEQGKSRSWNRLAHEKLDESFELAVFLDADIAFIDNNVISDGVRVLCENPDVEVFTGYPLKDIAASNSPTSLDRLSLATSQLTRYVGKLNGQFYVARMASIRKIWLPDQTPGEDGFLNAMVDTHGFTRPSTAGAIVQSSVPTHYFEAHSPKQFLLHERRMIVGTMINRWIFEYLWSLQLQEPAGKLIARLNADNPAWVDELIVSRVSGRRWVIPMALVTQRLRGLGSIGVFDRLVRLPLLLAATIFTIPSAIMANRSLRQRGAASIW